MMRRLFAFFVVSVVLNAVGASAGDWPMWRRDAGRTAVSADAVPDKPTLRWKRELPPLTPAFHSERLQFDACLLYTSPSPRDKRQSRMPSSA